MSMIHSPVHGERMADDLPSDKRVAISRRPRQTTLFALEPPPGLRGMPLAEALDCVAVLSGNWVDSTEARKTLVRLGVLPDGHVGTCRLYRILRHSGRFAHLGHGRYELQQPYRPKSELTPDQEDLLRRLRGGE